MLYIIDINIIVKQLNVVYGTLRYSQNLLLNLKLLLFNYIYFDNNDLY